MSLILGEVIGAIARFDENYLIAGVESGRIFVIDIVTRIVAWNSTPSLTTEKFFTGIANLCEWLKFVSVD